MPFCIVCEREVDAWLPHPNADARSPLMVMMGTVGSDLQHYLCPNCGCNDRDRHLWLYLTVSGLAGRFAGSRVLHIAPEAKISPLIVARQPAEYIRGDLFPTSPEFLRVDCERMEFADERFDIILCNHVLEHVSNPEAASREFYRTLASGGYLVAQTPYVPTLKFRLEFTDRIAPDRARFFYGQEDHVRLFGRDVADCIRSSGLEGDLFPHGHVLPDHDAARYGCNPSEPFFLFTKK